MAINWTTEQKQAIFDTDKDILVSAAAGSGKTTILIERVIEKILNGQDVDKLLIVTFTKLAAKEMKDRLISRLRVEINNTKDSELRNNLQKQLAKVPSADISTLHSFCSNVIKKFYYLIDLDPSFRLMTDDTEQELLKEKAWDKVRNNYYQEDDKEFLNLTKNFSNDRDDNGLQDLIFQLYNFAITSPDSNSWLETLSDLYQLDGDDFEHSKLYQTVIRPNLIKELNEQYSLMKKAQSISLENDSCEKFIDSINEAIVFLEDFIQNLGNYSYNQIGEALTLFSFKRAKTIRGAVKDGAFQLVETLRKDIKKALNETIPNELLVTQNQELTKIMNNSFVIVNKLIEAEKRFLVEFKNLKLGNSSIDFNDLEHFTMDIFNAKEDNRMIAAEYYQDKFSEIMIDEYQDVNPMQESIVQKLQQTSNNFFMVGDIKQSIYGFRQAAPYLFANKYEQFKLDNNNNELILLSNNFRSSKTVTSFVNRIFELVMDTQMGGVNYDNKTKLIPGANFSETADTQVEIDIIDSESSDEDSIDKRSSQINFITNRIKKLVDDKFIIFDSKKGESRPVKYSDIAILSRNKGNNTDLVSTFSAANIPIFVSDSQNYFQTMEIQVLIELLKLIDNPEQDIPLVAVLRSPIVGLDENQLAQIRLANKDINFYHATLMYIENNINELTKKLTSFVNLLKKMREQAKQSRISELIWYIYQETGFLDFVTGMPGGKQRAANLHALYQRANDFEAMNFQGLFKFIRFIERIEANDKDLSQPNSIDSNEDAVNVMTIHGSKGLEFPIVFLIDTAKEFNKRDFISSTLIDSQIGLGIKYFDSNTNLLYSTPIRKLISQKKKISTWSEELRLLYVALTRAKQKLIIIGAPNKLEQKVNNWNSIDLSAKKIDIYDRLNFKSYLDIIMSSILQDSTVTSQTSYLNKELDTQINIINSDFDNINTNHSSCSTPLITNQHLETNDKFDQTVKQILNFKYPYYNSVKTTAYQSVSEIKFLFGDPDEDSLEKSKIIDSGRYTLQDFAKPNFLIKSDNVTGAEIGSATHLVLQKLSLDSIPTIESVQNLITKITNNGLISSAVGQSIDISAIVDFYHSELGQNIFENKETLQREYPFSMVIPATKLFEDTNNNDDVLIHGIIDGLIETKEGIIIFDYKTDNVVDDNLAKNSVDSAVKKYSGQLNLYASAIESIENKQVIGKYLYFLKLGKYVKI